VTPTGYRAVTVTVTRFTYDDGNHTWAIYSSDTDKVDGLLRSESTDLIAPERVCSRAVARLLAWSSRIVP
jgi:hypothetical protein